MVRSAYEFLKLAFEEFERGVDEGSAVRLRDAAEKAWNVRELGFYDRYAARSGLLHGEVFYEGFWARAA